MRYVIAVVILTTVVIWDTTYKDGTYLRAIMGGVTKLVDYAVN